MPSITIAFVLSSTFLLAAAVLVAHQTMPADARRDLARVSVAIMYTLYVGAAAAGFAYALAALMYTLLVPSRTKTYNTVDVIMATGLCVLLLVLIVFFLAALL